MAEHLGDTVAFDRVVAALEAGDYRVTGTGRSRASRCPSHDDNQASLCVTAGQDRALLRCHANHGCTHVSIAKALGLSEADLFDVPKQRTTGNGLHILESYRYTDESGTLLFTVHRCSTADTGKTFRQQLPNGSWKLGAVRRVIYRYSKVLAALDRNETVYVAEGEKDVHALETAGVVATCNPGGAGKWRPEFSAPFKGHAVVVIADRDEPGRAHAGQVRKSLEAAGATVTVVEAAEGKDAADHLAAGHTVGKFAPVPPSAAMQSAAHSPETYPQNPQNPAPTEGFEGFEGMKAGEWPETTPLPGATDPIPIDALGTVLGAIVRAIGTALQVPTDLPASLALPLITTAARGGWTIAVEPGWDEPLCIATLSALPSGERKSPTLKALDKPLRAYEKMAQDRERPERSTLLAQKKLAEGRVEECRKAAVKSSITDNTAENVYLEAVKALEDIEAKIRPLPRWLADDATPEKFVGLLAEHRAIGVVSAEPGLFGILAGRYSSGAPNIEWLLKATSGEPLMVDRVGRDSEHVENPALSIASCIQPARLVDLGKVKAFRDSGLLARQLYSIPDSNVGTRGPTSQINEAAAAEWASHLTAVAKAGDERHENPVVIRLSGDGRKELEKFRAELEPHLHPGHGKYAGIADWLNKLPGAAVRIAAAITILGDPEATEITNDTMRNAIKVARAYISHAIAAFGLTRPNAEVFSQAKQILAVIVSLCRAERNKSSATRREIHQKVRDRNWVESSESLNAPLNILIDYGHIRQVIQIPGSQGGRPSECYRLHPQHLSDQSEPPKGSGGATHGHDSASTGVTGRIYVCSDCEKTTASSLITGRCRTCHFDRAAS